MFDRAMETRSVSGSSVSGRVIVYWCEEGELYEKGGCMIICSMVCFTPHGAPIIANPNDLFLAIFYGLK